MKTNILLIILGLSGIFQLLSISLDQYVIQKENQIRKLDNEITILNDQIDQIITSNISFGRFSYNRLIQVRDVLFTANLTKNSSIDILKEINKEHLNKVAVIVQNKYLPELQNYQALEIYNKTEKLLDGKKTDKSPDEIDDAFLQYQNILPFLYEASMSVKEERKIKSNLQKDILEKKFMMLVFGMMCNIVSIFFLFIFFYIQIRRETLKIG